MGMDHKEKYCLRKLLKTRKNERRKNNKNEKNWRGETQMEKWIARGSASSFVAHLLSVPWDGPWFKSQLGKNFFFHV